MLTHFSLFTGIGGIDLAAEWAGFETVGQCEWADYPTKVLEKHWPNVPRWRDIRSVTAEQVFDLTGLRTVDLISGGFPCQPFSVAGEQRGEDDDRYLWPEMLRVISELKPTWVLGENVTGIINMALDKVLAELECVGYEVQPVIIPAAGVNAQHRRERVFILAHTRDRCWRDSQRGGSGGNGCRELDKADRSSEAIKTPGPGEASRTLANTDSEWEQQCGKEMGKIRQWSAHGSWWDIEPELGRVAYGIPNRAHRLKCLGNAVVPQQVFSILKAIAEIESNSQSCAVVTYESTSK